MKKIRSVVTRRFTLKPANEELENLKAGKIMGRAVFSP
jgi:D-arabinose 1-dehydrogenase-like Zn-dependent alcohol dehydrogenase